MEGIKTSMKGFFDRILIQNIASKGTSQKAHFPAIHHAWEASRRSGGPFLDPLRSVLSSLFYHCFFASFFTKKCASKLLTAAHAIRIQKPSMHGDLPPFGPILPPLRGDIYLLNLNFAIPTQMPSMHGDLLFLGQIFELKKVMKN